MRRYAAWNAKNRKRIKPGGRRTFGLATLRWVKRRAKRKHQRIEYKRIVSKHTKMRLWMDWALRNESSIHYQQSRPMPLKRMKNRMLPLFTDCSGSTTGCYYAAGLKDPNGRAYDGSGYTGTMRSYMRRIASVDQARVGDCIIYGPGTGKHVVMVYEVNGDDPLCFSHGQESGPRLYPHSVEAKAFGGMFTVHSSGIN